MKKEQFELMFMLVLSHIRTLYVMKQLEMHWPYFESNSKQICLASRHSIIRNCLIIFQSNVENEDESIGRWLCPLFARYGSYRILSTHNRWF